MPAELRILRFSVAEVIEGLQVFAARTGKIRLEGGLRRLKLVEDREATAIIMVGDEPTRKLGFDDLMPAMIFYCVARKIPLPTKATKTLRVRGDKLEMVVNIEED